MKLLSTLMILFFSSQSYAGSLGNLQSATNYRCNLSSSIGEKSIFSMTLREYVKSGNLGGKHQVVLNAKLESPLALHSVEYDSVGAYPSNTPIIFKGANLTIISDLFVSGASQEESMNNLISTIKSLHFTLNTFIGTTWELPFVQVTNFSIDHIELSVETLERHSNQYEKVMDLTGSCELVGNN